MIANNKFFLSDSNLQNCCFCTIDGLLKQFTLNPPDCIRLQEEPLDFVYSDRGRRQLSQGACIGRRPYNEGMKILCPKCQEPLVREGRSWKCPNRHTYDIARQGYLNISPKQKPSGDAVESEKARTVFLEQGYYDFLKDALCALIEKAHPQSLLDIGCGEGYYTRAFARLVPETFGMDLSKDAIQHAAGRDKKTLYLVGSIYRLPFEDESLDMVVSVFTPLPLEEVARVLKPDGLFVVAGPGEMHHYELKDVLYDQVRLNEPPVETLDGFVLQNREELREKVHVKDPSGLLDMTPYRYRCSREGLQRVRDLQDGLDVTFDFVISEWRKQA